MADNELKVLRDGLGEHVNALAVDIGPRTPASPDTYAPEITFIRSSKMQGYL